MLIGDIETDGLLDTVTRIHCAVFYNILTGVYTEFTPETIHLIPDFLDKQPALCMHNGIGFDLQVFKKIFNYEYKGKYRDSLLMSRVFWPDKTKNFYYNEKGAQVFCKHGSHSVENWGIQFKNKKPEHEDWSRYTPEMLHRCKEDVKIQTMLYLYIQDWAIMLQIKDKRMTDLDRVWDMEQRIWWIMEEQAANGWAFNVEKAYSCVEELTKLLEDIDNALIPTLPTKFVSFSKNEKAFTKAFTRKGEMTATALKWVGEEKKEQVAGDFCKVVHKKINLNASAQVKDFLLSIGWIPTKYNFKKDGHKKAVRDENNKLIRTTPKIPKEVEEWEMLAKKLKHPAVKLMADRGKIKHRLGAVKGFIENARVDGRVPAVANTCSTNTARMAHRIVVNVPKADGKVFYGTEMRSLFIAEKGKVLVGCDASALEARCEAHYVYSYDKSAALELVEGDVHSKNALIFETDRSTAKSGKYAILYGCSPVKLAETLGKSNRQAKSLYESYWTGNPALKQLKKDLVKEWEQYGYLLAIDGRPLTIRYEHALINTLFQSAGAIAMKIANCWLYKKLKEGKFDFKQVGNFHDEFQIECCPKDAEVIGNLMAQSIGMAGKILKFNVPLTGESKAGGSWAETH